MKKKNLSQKFLKNLRLLKSSEREVLVALILGDGQLVRDGENRPLLHYEKNGAMENFLKHICSRFPLHVHGGLQRKNKKMFIEIYLHPRDYMIYKFYFYKFKENIKKIPDPEFQQLLTKRTLAYWYMDKGYYRKDKKNLYINTQVYSLENHEKIKEILMKNFGYAFNIQRDGKRFRLYLPLGQQEHFINYLEKYIIYSLRRKYEMNGWKKYNF